MEDPHVVMLKVISSTSYIQRYTLPHHLENALYDLVNVFSSLLLAFQQPVCQFAPSFAIAAAYSFDPFGLPRFLCCWPAGSAAAAAVAVRVKE